MRGFREDGDLVPTNRVDGALHHAARGSTFRRNALIEYPTRFALYGVNALRASALLLVGERTR